MALGLFQWIGVGLVIAIILIPLARWFWKRFDMPSKFAIEYFKQKQRDAEEEEMWAGIESQIEAEEKSKLEFEMKQREKQQAAGKALDPEESAEVWNKLGIDVPIQPVKREEAPPVVLENTVLANPSKNTEEPDWELVDKMSKLAEPVEGIPDAPDLEQLSKEESE